MDFKPQIRLIVEQEGTLPIFIYILDLWGIGAFQSEVGFEWSETWGLGFSRDRFSNFVIFAGSKLFHFPILGIARAWINPAYSPSVGHDHSFQLEFPGIEFFFRPNSKIIINFILCHTKFDSIYKKIPFFLSGSRCATKVPRIPLIAFSMSTPSLISNPNRT